jgi:hypothetical protein
MYVPAADCPPLLVVKQVKTFERGNYPPLPHWDRRAILPNHIKFRTWKALAPMFIFPLNESAELAHGALLLIPYSEAGTHREVRLKERGGGGRTCCVS